jgi:hypothetical protein
MAAREVELLVEATEALPRIPASSLDVLVIDEIGKNVSGVGMDPNVVGRSYAGPSGSALVQRIVVRDLTDETDGNGVGIGLADVALSRAVDKLDRRKTYMNVVTSKTPEEARIPITVETDRDALDVALACCLNTRSETARVVRIRDTEHLETMLVSEAVLPEVIATGRCDVIEPLHEIAFDAAGMFAESLRRVASGAS